MPEICPRCHEAIRRGAIWTPIQQGRGRARVFHVQHRKGNGATCVVYLGERATVAMRAEHTYDCRTSVFAVMAALAQRERGA